MVAEAGEALGWTIGGYYVEEGLTAASPAPKGKVVKTRRDDPLDPQKTGCRMFAVGIGNNQARLWWCRKLIQDGFELPPLVHPAAWVSPSAQLGEGVFVGAGVVVQAEAKIGRAALVNTHATVEHHVEIGAGAHLGPGAVLAGLVQVGEEAMIGAGAVVKDRIQVGARAIVGAGAAVVQNVAPETTVVGVPAKVLK